MLVWIEENSWRFWTRTTLIGSTSDALMAAKVSYQVHSSVLPRDNTKVSKRTSQLSGPMSSHSLSTMSHANNFKNRNLNPFTSLTLVISIKWVFHATHLEQNNQYVKSYTSSSLHNASQLIHISYVCNSFIIHFKHYTYCIAADPYLMSVILSSQILATDLQVTWLLRGWPGRLARTARASYVSTTTPQRRQTIWASHGENGFTLIYRTKWMIRGCGLTAPAPSDMDTCRERMLNRQTQMVWLQIPLILIFPHEMFAMLNVHL